MNRWSELSRLDGLFVGMLDDAETRLFDEAVEAGIARRSYEGGGGFMGLAKVRVNHLALCDELERLSA